MLTREQVTELCQVDTGGAPVVSFYLNLDKQRTDDDYAIRAKNLLRDAEERAAALDPRFLDGIRSDLQRIRSYLADQHDLSAQSLAIFASTPADIWQVYELRQPVESCVAVALRPHVRPLIRLFDTAPDYLAVIISRDRSRIFARRRAELKELDTDNGPEVEGQHAQGGWSQANYQRHIEDHVRAHFQTVAARLFQLFQEQPYRYLIIAGPIEVTSAFVEHLHPYVRERLIGTTHLQMDAGYGEITATLRGVLNEKIERERATLLDKLAGGTGDADRSVSGLTATNDALQQGQVQTLLVDDTLSLAGFRCPQCGFVTTEQAGKCPYDSTALISTENVIDPLVESAFLQEARIVQYSGLEERERLRAIGGGVGLGALLRYAKPSPRA